MAADLFAVLDGAATSAAPFVTVVFPGNPRGKGRPRSRIAGKGPKQFVHVYTDPKTAKFEADLAWIAKGAMKGRQPLAAGVPIAVRMFVMVPIPVSWPKRDRDAALVGTMFPTSKPDSDNYLKILDAFNEIVWADDSQICRSLVVKEYGEKPGLIIEVYTLP